MRVLDLPSLTRAPNITQSGGLGEYTTLILPRWDPELGDYGDGPVVSYIVRACEGEISALTHESL